MADGLLDNESDDSDDESQEEENLAEVEDEEPSSRTRFEAGRSRSGRRVTRYLLKIHVLHFQPQFHYCDKMEKLKITIMRLQGAEMK